MTAESCMAFSSTVIWRSSSSARCMAVAVVGVASVWVNALAVRSSWGKSWPAAATWVAA